MAESWVSERIVRAYPEGFGPPVQYWFCYSRSRQIIAWAKCNPMHVFAHKVSLEHSCTHSFTCSAAAFFPSTVPELSSCHRDSRAFKPWYLLSDLYRKGAEPCDYSIGCTLESLLKKAQGAGPHSTPRPQTSRMGSRNHCVPSRCLESRLPWKHISGSKCVFTWDMALDEAL